MYNLIQLSTLYSFIVMKKPHTKEKPISSLKET